MSSGEPARRLATEPARRTHHISDIAHHFLTDAEVGQGPAAAFVWIVAASGPWPWTAPAALELARLTARDGDCTVHLAEDDAPPWTVRAHLGDGDGEVRLADPGETVVHGEGPLCWHLGPVAGDRLDDLAAARRAPGCRLPGVGREKGLDWCLEQGEVEAWSALLGLGRLVDILAPATIDLVCMPRMTPRSGRGRAVGTPGPESLSVLARRAGDACARDVEVHLLAPNMTAAARGAVLSAVHRKAIARAGAFCAGPDSVAPLA